MTTYKYISLHSWSSIIKHWTIICVDVLVLNNHYEPNQTHSHMGRRDTLCMIMSHLAVHSCACMVGLICQSNFFHVLLHLFWPRAMDQYRLGLICQEGICRWVFLLPFPLRMSNCFYFFARKIQVRYRSSQEIQSTPNIIKIISNCLG
jgi:hypothetical protein